MCMPTLPVDSTAGLYQTALTACNQVNASMDKVLDEKLKPYSNYVCNAVSAERATQAKGAIYALYAGISYSVLTGSFGYSTLLQLGATAIANKIVDYVESQVKTHEIKQEIQTILIAKAKTVHADCKSMSNAEVLSLVEDHLNKKYSGTGIDYFVKLVEAIPENKRAYKLDKFSRILIKEGLIGLKDQAVASPVSQNA